MESNKSSIGSRIAALRKGAGLKQRELADRLLVSRELINLWENDTRMIKGDDIARLADALGTTCDYLLRGISTEKLDIHKAIWLQEDGILALMGLSSEETGELNFLLTSEPFRRFLNVLHEYKEHWSNLLKSEVWQEQQADACSKAGKCFAYIDPESSIHAKMRRCAKLDLHECISAITDAIDATYQNRKEGE